MNWWVIFFDKNFFNTFAADNVPVVSRIWLIDLSDFNFFNTGSVLIIILPIVSTAVVPAASKKISGFLIPNSSKKTWFKL